MIKQLKAELQMGKQLKKLLRGENGSYTVEATLLFPIIFLMLISSLLLGLKIYIKAEMFAVSSEVALQTAYAWGDSNADLRTGHIKHPKEDGLYWQVEQQLHVWLNALFQAIHARGVSDDQKTHVEGEYSALLQKKLQRSLQKMPSSYRTEIHYETVWNGGKVVVQASQPFSSPVALFPAHITADASAWTVDPVEWIRGTQLLRFFVQELKSRNIDESEAERAIREYLDLSPQHLFRYHRQAAPYLRKLVNGKETEMILQSGKIRVIDALDTSGVAHQAYVTFTVKNLREQMVKDVELLENGRVQGVVWHFFKRAGTTGSTGPPEDYVLELQSYGIKVVLHE